MTEEIEKQAELEYMNNKNWIDGAKWGMEHAIEWHDLRKNPSDLPEVKGYYWVALKNHSICTLSYFNHSEMEFNDEAIAWCVPPKFKE